MSHKRVNKITCKFGGSKIFTVVDPSDSEVELLSIEIASQEEGDVLEITITPGSDVSSIPILVASANKIVIGFD
jgi:hypothetical protein